VASPSGAQFEFAFGDGHACAVEVGGGLRTYAHGGRQVLDGYRAAAMCTSGRGQVLAPWPNRLENGAYAFDGSQLQAPINELETGTAIHGLVRWANWTLADRDVDRVALEHTLHPSPGYPFALALRVEYRLDSRGLTVTTAAENVGDLALPFGLGYHPYLCGAPRVDDLVVAVPAATQLVTDERSLPVGREPATMREARPLAGVVLDTTFCDLGRDAEGIARVLVGDDAVWLDDAFGYVHLFTGDPLPDVARRSLAVEPLTCPPNAFRSSEALVRLEPGERFTARWGIEPNHLEAYRRASTRPVAGSKKCRRP
jgi:aldose 1-epimerase